MSDVDRYLEGFARLEREELAAGRSWPWLGPVRKDALARFAERGFPTTRDEDWKFTSPAAIARTPYRLIPPTTQPAAPDPVLLAALRSGVAGAVELVFVNGRFAPALSQLPPLPQGAVAMSLQAALDDDSGEVKGDWLEADLGRHAAVGANPFVALNTAFFLDGAFVRVPRGVALAVPIHVLHLALPAATVPHDDAPPAYHPRTLIVVGESAQATVIESWAGLTVSPYFHNAVTEIVCGANSAVVHHKLQLEGERAFHVATLQVRQERASSFRSLNLDLGGELVRNDLNVVQAGEGIDCALEGLYVTDAHQHVDNHTAIDHAHPHGTSRELYKGILAGSSHAVFNGKVLVRPGAQKTDARQTNRNLILSREALVDTKPQLEIFADDVKCSHGATIGQLDGEALFYLRSRGLDEAAARGLLTFAFAAEIVDRIAYEPLRARVHDRLLARLPGGRAGHGALREGRTGATAEGKTGKETA